MAHQSEEVRPHIQAERVDKQRQAERLGKVEHSVVGTQVEVAGKDADEEYEGDAKRYSLYANTAQCQSKSAGRSGC